MSDQPLTCTFCGKNEKDVAVLFCYDTPLPPRHLCDDCVTTAAQYLLDKVREMSKKVVIFKAQQE